MTSAAAAGQHGLLALQERLGYHFVQPALLDTALNHSGTGQSNQRLEFLGDAVLGAAASAYYYRQAPEWDEGQLSVARTTVVCRDSLAAVAAGLQLAPLLRLSKGVSRSGPVRTQASVLADAVEALIGAVFLDGGYAAAEQVTLRILGDRLSLDVMVAPVKAAKNQLQEWLQARGWPVPVYALLPDTGPAHDRLFEAECRLAKPALSATGQGRSRKLAEQAAAEKILQLLQQGPKP